MPISSDMFSGDGGWLNTSNSSKEYVRSTIPSEHFSSSFSSSSSYFSSSFLSSPSSRMSWGEDAPIEGVATKVVEYEKYLQELGLPLEQ